MASDVKLWTSDGVRDAFGGTDQSPKRKRGVSPMPASRQKTRSLTLGALIALCIHDGAPADFPTSGVPKVSCTPSDERARATSSLHPRDVAQLRRNGASRLREQPGALSISSELSAFSIVS